MFSFQISAKEVVQTVVYRLWKLQTQLRLSTTSWNARTQLRTQGYQLIEMRNVHHENYFLTKQFKLVELRKESENVSLVNKWLGEIVVYDEVLVARQKSKITFYAFLLLPPTTHYEISRGKKKTEINLQHEIQTFSVWWDCISSSAVIYASSLYLWISSDSFWFRFEGDSQAESSWSLFPNSAFMNINHRAVYI